MCPLRNSAFCQLAVPPREWVYGHFLIKRFISVLGAPGGTGKTAYAFTIALCMPVSAPFSASVANRPPKVVITDEAALSPAYIRMRNTHGRARERPDPSVQARVDPHVARRPKLEGWRTVEGQPIAQRDEAGTRWFTCQSAAGFLAMDLPGRHNRDRPDRR